jgi:hypothetical protein
MKVILNVPLKLPGGFEAELPTVRVPPIFNSVKAGGIVFITKGETGSEAPI